MYSQSAPWKQRNICRWGAILFPDGKLCFRRLLTGINIRWSEVDRTHHRWAAVTKPRLLCGLHGHLRKREELFRWGGDLFPIGTYGIRQCLFLTGTDHRWPEVDGNDRRWVAVEKHGFGYVRKGTLQNKTKKLYRWWGSLFTILLYIVRRCSLLTCNDIPWAKIDRTDSRCATVKKPIFPFILSGEFDETFRSLTDREYYFQSQCKALSGARYLRSSIVIDGKSIKPTFAERQSKKLFPSIPNGELDESPQFSSGWDNYILSGYMVSGGAPCKQTSNVVNRRSTGFTVIERQR